MKQITSAIELIRTLRRSHAPDGFNGVPYALWAPGDSTLYRIALVTVWPCERDSELPTHAALLASVVRENVLLDRPASPDRAWTPDRFMNIHGRRFAGWWPALRPVLAGLGWTPLSDRDTDFRPTDWPLITALSDV